MTGTVKETQVGAADVDRRSTTTSIAKIGALRNESHARVVFPGAEKGHNLSRLVSGISTDTNSKASDVTEKTSHKKQDMVSVPVVRDLDARIAYKTRIAGAAEPSVGNTGTKNANSYLQASMMNRVSTENYGSTVGDPVKALPRTPGASIEKAFLNTAAQQKSDATCAPTSGSDESLADIELGPECQNELAIAIEVDDEDDDFIAASAVEYDPDSKPPLYRNRRFRLYALVSAIMLVAIIIAASIGLASQKTSMRQQTPLNQDDGTLGAGVSKTDAVVEQLELLVGAEVLKDESSAEYRAKEWILNIDPMQLDSQASGLAQRYMLAVVYFKLHEEGEWLSCNAPTEEDQVDLCVYQKQVSIFPQEYVAVSASRWLSGDHECAWAGINCDDFKQLRTLELTGQEIKGTLPAELSYFPLIQGIALAWNQLQGSIPDEYGEMSHLLTLELHYNEISGSLPASLANSKNLQMVNVGNNALTGSIPSSIGTMSNLKALFLFENSLTGSIPAALSKVSLLTYLRLHKNRLTGTIPPELGDLSPREIWLQQNEISGTIPSEVGQMESLLDLRFQQNDISGTLPDELYGLTNLYRLDLFETNITGTLSPLIGNLEALDTMRLRNTNLDGSIPTEIGLLESLETLWLDGTKFEGSVPAEYCNNTSVFSQVIADCLPPDESSPAQVSCECCDICCDPQSGNCKIVRE